MYLNSVYFGRGATGIYNASYAYFDKSPADLNSVEAVYLASLLSARLDYLLMPNPMNNSLYEKNMLLIR